ncbi:DUF2339 domain-containing protein [Mangrovimonas sp. AS39]|uniref:DUF2339 domain-containing protein n=1 Tax=Mangrovimonas futianensis TaxID=2895523 RepID=UPI001E49A015|nr:DUF2339 domain-containing protein [Mangrovimonas futianensis]MCF1191574.1 DUF2339 domain-containing protein [Mangrovimonas futianensis]MCF1195538.1 DUF2339 domain-containing protein [Mangrovimonas futianensis]
MTSRQDQINQLLTRLNSLVEKQRGFSKEIDDLKHAIETLQNSQPEEVQEPEIKKQEFTDNEVKEKSDSLSSIEVETPSDPLKSIQPRIRPVKQKRDTAKVKSDLEKFIGENLINKIGIIITVIGVFIGVKYSIEHDLISPLTRVILGYLAGLGLLGFGIKLKTKYENYSAVLVSGAMAIFYFISFSAYNFYQLIPQALAFVLMVIFTVFTVLAALNYNRQVIAHIGLVGAYAVPFVLSNESGRPEILFGYMAIINIGILVIAFKKYWKLLYYVAFGLTWAIYFTWFISYYRTSEYFGLALTFLSLFFFIFYATFLAYKLLQKEKFERSDIALLLFNSFIFYGNAYVILSGHETGKQLLGLFTLGNALVHFLVGLVIYRQKLGDKNLFYLVVGLVLVFITIAIPVQLDGNWVTFLWIGEAALLFWIGRTKKVPVYEKLSYPLMLLAFLSIIHDWIVFYNAYTPSTPEDRMMPLLNIQFLTSLCFIAGFGFILKLHFNQKYDAAWKSNKILSKMVSFGIPAIFLLGIYFAFRMEIVNYWGQLFTDSLLEIKEDNQQYPMTYWNYDLLKFETVWVVNYSMLFMSLLGIVNIRWFKNKFLGFVNLGFIVFVLLVFLTNGLYALSELRESYLDPTKLPYYKTSIMHILIRYLSFVFVVLLLITIYKYLQESYRENKYKRAFDFLLHTTILWVVSSELIHWLDMAESSQSYKLGLSILWGVYSLFLIALGIWKRNKPLRIGAIVLFGLTLIKLFFYDISHLDTIAKTIVFVSLGVLLLIISFLYNKFTHKISDETPQ